MCIFSSVWFDNDEIYAYRGGGNKITLTRGDVKHARSGGNGSVGDELIIRTVGGVELDALGFLHTVVGCPLFHRPH